jgi:hypothetical protein
MLFERDQLVVELDRPAHRVVPHHERPTIQGVRISLSVSFAAEQNDPRHGGCGHVPRISPTESQQANPAIVNAGKRPLFHCGLGSPALARMRSYATLNSAAAVSGPMTSLKPARRHPAVHGH